MHKVWISVGSSRKEMNWKNTEVLWSALVERFKKPQVTEETYQQYLKMTKDQQGAVKDVGGFVGGVIRGGRRLLNSVSARHLLTLDIDKGSLDFFEEITMLYGNALVLYTTHKHSKLTPRYRLIMPLSREMFSDEYEAMARKIAGNLGIETFDPTTFQPERLMYWPSRSLDGEFSCQVQDGPVLDVDDVLLEYADWTDTSQWPVSEEAKRAVARGIAKQEDPLEKPGMIGAWCRTYGVDEVIEKFLPHVYIKTEHDDRYTYAEGSTHAGVIVYDNKFSFSHHSTDPSGGRLCNSFDLVRIHLFGDLDTGPDVPANKRPSYVKMTEFVSKDSETKKNFLTAQIREATQEFALLDGLEVRDDEDLDWTKQLECDKKGNVLNTIGNVVVILNNDNRLKNCLAYDDFSKRAMVMRSLPWRMVDRFTGQLMDSDDAGYRNYLEGVYKITSISKIKDGIDLVLHQHKFHPVIDYLKSLKWDGKERVERLLIDHLGAEDSVYVREVTRKTFVAAVSRVFEPGIKFDHVMLLKGPQGIGKSRLISKMGGKWYSDTFGSLQNNAAMENIQGVWIMEIGEMAGFKRQEVETIKLFISKCKDQFRVAYGKLVSIFPRQNIFIASTNEETPLHDVTGGRRFWPIVCTKKFGDLKREEINQLWAECCVLYTLGEDLFLTPEIEDMANEVQKEFTEHDNRTSIIEHYLDVKVPLNWYDLSVHDRRGFLAGDETIGKGEMIRDWTCVPEIWYDVMRGEAKDMTRFNTKFIRDIMNNMKGWKPLYFNRKPFGNQRGWERVVLGEKEPVNGSK